MPCQHPGCERPATARGLCLMHYKRWRRRNRDAVYDWRKGLEERLSARVRKVGECWVWTGPLTDGYGQIAVGSRTDGTRRNARAHCVSYELRVGPVPAGKELDHTCRVRACINPDHLEPVPRRTNILRGESVVADNARKTHCPQGHSYDEANTIRGKDGSRSCRTCRVARRLRFDLASPAPC